MGAGALGSMNLTNFYNIVFSKLIDVWFRISEPIMLVLARNFYSNTDEEDLVSIIIGTYNRSDILLERTIPSILAQSYTNIEVVVVGDQCIDDTPEKIKNIDDKRVVFIDLPKRGKYPKHIKDRWFVQGSVPRNKGMKIANGKWFVFISDDDIIYENHIETLLKAAKKENLEFISASFKSVKDGEEFIVHPGQWNIGSDLVCGGMQTWMYRSYLKCFKWNRHSWRKGFDRPVDYDLQQRFYRSGVKMNHINDVIFYNPPVEGTNTTGYQAALLADSEH